MPSEKKIAYRRPVGMRDLLPEELAEWTALENVARALFASFGYREIRPPLLEPQRLFVRSLGEVTDIVEKEMYVFGEGEEALVLRPEATAPVVRAYVENHLHRNRALQKLYYLGPMFRRERPQANRLRQFHQLGTEALGSGDPLLDAEAMILAMRIFREMGLSEAALQFNTLGCDECRPRYREALARALAGERARLCPLCRQRFERNVFRVLDCKNRECQAIAAGAPEITGHLCAGCRDHFAAVRRGLEAGGQSGAVNPRLARGFDYYTRTVFEVHHPRLGARSAIAGGGRYDRLIAEIGGPDLGAVGFAAGVEATLEARRQEGAAADAAGAALDVCVVCVDPACRPYAFRAVDACRRAGLAADMDYEGRGLRGQLRDANRRAVPWAAIVGPSEEEQGVVLLKRMTGPEAERGQESVPLAELAGALRRRQAETG